MKTKIKVLDLISEIGKLADNINKEKPYDCSKAIRLMQDVTNNKIPPFDQSKALKYMHEKSFETRYNLMVDIANNLIQDAKLTYNMLHVLDLIK